MNGLSVFSGFWIVLLATLGARDAVRDERDLGRVLLAFAGLIVAASSRNLIWIYVGFEAFWLALPRVRSPRLGTLVSSVVSLAGVVVVAASSRASDLAELEPTASVCVGVVLLLAGVTMKWLRSRASSFSFLGASVALVSVLVRVSAWAPGIADALSSVAWLAAAAALVVGGLGSALSRSTNILVFWLTVVTVGLAVFGLAGGPPAFPYVLLHLAASVAMLALLSCGAPPVGKWIAILSLASVPPLPGFVTKLNVLSGLTPGALTVSLAGLLLAGLGCVRELDRSRTEERAWVTLATIAAALVLGLFPETILRVTMRAVAGLF